MVLLAEKRCKVQEEGGISVNVGGDELDSLNHKNILVKVFVPHQSRDNVGRRAVPTTEAGGGMAAGHGNQAHTEHDPPCSISLP